MHHQDYRTSHVGTRNAAVLGGRRFDLITAFRFFLNAQPSLREEAMASLASVLKDGKSRLLFNVHGNRYSTRALVAAKAKFTREQFAAMSARASTWPHATDSKWSSGMVSAPMTNYCYE